MHRVRMTRFFTLNPGTADIEVKNNRNSSFAC